MKSRRVLTAVALFLCFMISWAIYEKGVELALYPIALPVYLFLAAFGETKLLPIALLLYACVLALIFERIKRHLSLRWIFGFVGILLTAHLLSYLAVHRAFDDLGSSITEQMLGIDKK